MAGECYAAAKSTPPEVTASTVPEAPLLEQERKEEESKGEKKEVARVIKERPVVRHDQIMHDVIVCLNHKQEDMDDVAPGFVTGYFALALCQQCVPIVVTEPVVASFFAWLHHTGPLDYLVRDAKEKLKKTFSDAAWDVYTSGGFYRFIPKVYGGTLGWAKDSGWKQIALESIIKNRAHLKKELAIDVATLIASFETPSTGYWNIVIYGHGMYSEASKVPAAKVLHPTHAITQAEVKDGAIAGLFFVDFKRFLNFISQPEVKINFFYYCTCYGGDVNAILPYTVTLLNEKGGKNVLRFDTTRAGFTVMVGAVSDSPTISRPLTSLTECAKGKPISSDNVDFATFFTKAHEFERVGDMPKRFSMQELKILGQAITQSHSKLTPFDIQYPQEDPFLVANIPLVKGPQSDSFQPLLLNKHQYYLNKAWVQKRVLEGSASFEFIDPQAILVSAPEVPIPLSIIVSPDTLAPAIISMIPGQSLIKFDSLKITSTFSTFFTRTMGTVRSLNANFYFKKLRLMNDQYGPHIDIDKYVTLTDVFVLLRGFSLIVYFTDRNGTRYSIVAQAAEFSSLSLKFYTLATTLKYPILPAVIIPDNQFLDAVVHYFSKGDMHGIFDVLSPKELKTIRAWYESEKYSDIERYGEIFGEPVSPEQEKKEKEVAAEAAQFKKEAEARMKKR